MDRSELINESMILGILQAQTLVLDMIDADCSLSEVDTLLKVSKALTKLVKEKQIESIK